MEKIRNFWDTLTINNKIKVFTGSVLLAMLAALLFIVWIVRLFMVDFNDIMEDNSNGSEIVAAISDEIEAFDNYVHSADPANSEQWDSAVAAAKDAIYRIPLNYKSLGDEKFSRLQSLQTAYEVYAGKRNQVIADYQSDKLYIDTLYDVYNMQEYLLSYAQNFVDVTMLEGNKNYKELAPIILSMPFLAAALGIILFLGVLQISRMLNKTLMVPVVKLAKASRNIASNNFFIDDVVVDNRDELGELVTAFNKMKFTTSEYIKALEEKREALDQLHAQEMENLEIEKQLETMNLELLKSQINPHFLFNTLNVIAGMANLEDASTTEQMIEALSSLFRYNLKNQEKEALLSQELKISGDYMYLQKMRFGSRVEYEVECEVDEGSVIVPTFTFQPLLENAMIHGISPKVEGGRISVHIRKENGQLLITIADTGAGIDEETLEKIRQQLEGGEDTVMDEQKVGIGLGNINRRIKAMYPDGSFDIDSKKNEGTTISIRIPLQGAGEAPEIRENTEEQGI